MIAKSRKSAGAHVRLLAPTPTQWRDTLRAICGGGSPLSMRQNGSYRSDGRLWSMLAQSRLETDETCRC
jgi:hypothetical protein